MPAVRPLCRRSLSALLALALATAAGGGEPAGEPFTLAQLLSYPQPSSLTAARDAPRIAWVMNEGGVRNLWTAAAPDFEPRRLTAYDADDGQPLDALALTAGGEVLVYARGSGPNAAGEIANPNSDPAGAERAIWAVATDGSGQPWKVAVTPGVPVVAPAGDSLVYAQGSRVFAVPLAAPDGAAGDAEPPAPQRLFQARGSLGQLAFAPGGERLAFTSNRGDHSFVGVFDAAAGRITWMAPSVDRDQHPAWSPDGRRLAFLRAPGLEIGQRPDLTRGNRFAVWVGDPESGTARELWASPGDDGGFAQFYPATALAWAGDERLIFTSEHHGWLHVYALDPAGGEVVDLSPGPYEIESFAVSPGGETVYFWGNHQDRERRHLWRVPAAGGPPAPVTSGDGIEVEPTPLADGVHLALRRADARRPMAVAVVRGDGGGLRTIAPAVLPAAFPAARLVVPETVSFTAVDGAEIHGQLFLPPEAAAGGRHPGVLFLHGGPVRQMLGGWHYSSYYAHCYAFNQYLASRGYAVLAVNFRGGIGYGRDFRLTPGQGPRGAWEYHDVRAAGRFLARRPEVDGDRIGLWGGSYGGLLTAMGLARDSQLFAAGVDLHGVHDWAFRATDFPLPGGFWGLGEDDLELAYRSSPVADVGGWRSPVLFVHGDDDRNVLFQQTTDLVQRLRRREVHVETLIFPDEVHGFLRHASWHRTFVAAADFFDRFLRLPAADRGSDER